MFWINSLKSLFPRKKIVIPPRWEIVIDPGHGGHALGAVNKRYGYREKDINLGVAEFMREYINSDWPHIIATMTRVTDRTVSLPDRVELANYGHTDCFISLHSNARLVKGKYGLEIETFTYGKTEGYILAKRIQEALVLCKYLGVPVIDRGIKLGKFYVLRKTAMPAVLVELGFLSDDEEAQLLIKPENQKVMAEAITSGVVQWLEDRESVGKKRVFTE